MDIPEGTRFCGECGKAFQSPVVSPGAAHNRFCVGCGRAMSWDANVCQYCGHDFRARPVETAKDQLVIGGVLTMLAGILSVALTTILIANAGEIGSAGVAMAALVYSCAAIGVLGGIVALTRTSFPFAVFGAACSVIGPAFFFGIPGLVLIAKSSRVFSREPAGRM